MSIFIMPTNPTWYTTTLMSYVHYWVSNDWELNCLLKNFHKLKTKYYTWEASWASYQIRKIAGCACAGNAGNVFPRRRFQRKPVVSDPGMHHGTCVTHVPWCMSGSLTCGDGENVPGIPGACAPAILRIWQEAHAALSSWVVETDINKKLMGCQLAVLSQTPRKLLGFYWIKCRFWPDFAYIKHCYTQKFYCSYSSFISQCLRTGKFHGVCCLKHSLFDNWKGICMLHDTFKLRCKVRVKTSWWLLMVWCRLGIRTSATNMMIQYGQYIYIYISGVSSA